MSESQLYRYAVVRHDGPLRFMVPSRRPNTAPYLVELDSYNCNGQCVCRHFVTRLEPLLRRGYTPERALDEGLAKIPSWGTVEDALRCFHCHAARLKFADDVIQAINKQRKQDAQRNTEANRPKNSAALGF